MEKYIVLVRANYCELPSHFQAARVLSTGNDPQQPNLAIPQLPCATPFLPATTWLQRNPTTGDNHELPVGTTPTRLHVAVVASSSSHALSSPSSPTGSRVFPPSIITGLTDGCSARKRPHYCPATVHHDPTVISSSCGHGPPRKVTHARLKRAS